MNDKKKLRLLNIKVERALKKRNVTTVSGGAAVSGGGGATEFTDLTDVPSSYSGQGYKIVRVNAGATALEFHTAGEMAASNYPRGNNIINASDTAEVQYNFLWYAGSSASGNSDLIGTSLMPNDSVLTCEIHGQGIAADGSEGVSVIKVLSMRRDGSSTPVAIGTETTNHVVTDSANSPTISLSVSSGDLRVSVDSDSLTVYHWTIYAKISISKV